MPPPPLPPPLPPPSPLDGLEATRQIRAFETDKAKLPIIALTANATEEDARACRNAGMNAFASKPLNAADFFNAMLAALGAD